MSVIVSPSVSAFSLQTNNSTVNSTEVTQESTEETTLSNSAASNQNGKTDTSASDESNQAKQKDDASSLEEESTQESEPKKQTAADIAKRQSRADISSAVKVLDWAIIDAQNEEISESNAAVSNRAYDLVFKLQLGSMQAGDTFTIDIPQVGGTSKDNDHWYMQATNEIEVKDDSDEVVYTYKIQEKPGANTQEIKFQIKKTSLQTVELDLELPGMLANFVKTSGVFPVTFGKNENDEPFTKNMKFEINELKMANGFSFKFNTAVSNNSVKWGIRFNEAANLELAGDEVNYKVNGGAGNPYQGFYLDNPLRKPENWHEWGENYTDVWSPEVNNQGTEDNYGGYIEDELPPGATVTEFTISSFINLPIGLSANDLTNQVGGIPSTTAAYESYVLADYGNGPTYRKNGDTGTLKPKENTGFKLLKQNPGETKSDFKNRVQSEPYQYGIYQDSSDRKTVMIHFGSLKKADNDQERLQDQTNEEYSDKTFKDKDGKEHTIPQFAVEAAQKTINDERSGYTNDDRDLLERYFTLTYGESNAIKGAIAAYNISLNVRYDPETTGAVMNTANIYNHSALTLNRTVPERMPKANSSTTTLRNPIGHITLSSTEVLLQKLDADLFTENGDYIGINGAEFKLQRKVENGWQDIGDSIYTTDNISYIEEENEKQLAGMIRLNIETIIGDSGAKLTDTFRFVETKAPTGFSDRDSPNWSNEAQAIVSDEFTLNNSSTGVVVTVWNRHKQASYKVEHWIQKDNTPGSSTDDFELAYTEEKEALAGDKVQGQPLDSLQITHYYNASFTSQYGQLSGTVPDPASGDPELVLKLYYTKDKVIPFTLYKLGIDGKPLRKTETEQVTFQLYRWMYGKQPPEATWENTPPTPENIAKGYWTYVVENKTTGKLTSQATKPSDTDLVKQLELTTDELGRIRDERLVYSTDFGARLALVEVENTHSDYEIPEITDNYWVVQIKNPTGFDWVEGYGTKKTGKVQYKPEGSAINYWAIPNRFEVSPTIYKVDEDDNPMASDNTQKVEFDVYEYIGPDNIRPDKVTNEVRDFNNPLASAYKANWQKLGASPYQTDAQGKIVDTDNNPIVLDDNKIYSFIETKTLAGYQLPNNQSFTPDRANHWLVSLGGNLQLSSGVSGYVDARPSQWLANFYEKATLFEVKPSGIYLKNRKLTEIPIFKVDENLNPIRQSSAENFQFEAYLYQSSGDYKTTPLSDSSWKKISSDVLADSFDGDGLGQLFTEDDTLENKIGRTEVVKEQIVGIKEIKGMTDYNNHTGYWVVKLVWDPNAKVNNVTSIEYFENNELVTNDEDTEYHKLLNGKAYLKNSRVPAHDFSFIKEDEQQNPLGNVSFALYKAKSETGSENPNDQNTRWDITEEPYREATSSMDTYNLGTVFFQGLVTGEYLLLETKTVEGYQLPQGYWILTVSNGGEVTIRGSTDPPPPAFYKKDNQYYLPNYRATVMPKAGGIGLHVIVSIGIMFLGLAAIVLLEIYKEQFLPGVRFVIDKLKK
ncbi:hypothetical protein RU96_GL000655 [Enterococcus canintestini]|uniref:SpaA-like prealbumin fold domain-containing protein n=1 Tax=Enterococcus canintestini TaxID=317010 RepID=A0A1L8R4U3_9ENTE|nr:hypothetical protein RU96_GL000655 [Enterococcus canintestini]